MLTIKDNRIRLTKGDTLTLELSLTKDGETYTPVEGDEIRFALAIGYVGRPEYELILTQTIPSDTLTFTIPASETEMLAYMTYYYDVEITHADGCVDTVLLSTLTITGEAE